MAAELNLYLDASAFVKRYVTEDGSEIVDAAMGEATTWISSRIATVESLVTLRSKAGPDELKAARRDLSYVQLVEVDEPLCDRAVDLARKHGLRTLDALHLASAMVISHDLSFATWDGRLHAAAQAEGFATLPASLG